MSVKQKINEILKREGVSEEDCGHAWPSQPKGGKGRCMSCVSIDKINYVAKLEKLVRELGEMSEALKFYGAHENWSEALTRLNKLLDEMGAE